MKIITEAKTKAPTAWGFGDALSPVSIKATCDEGELTVIIMPMRLRPGAKP